VWDWPASLVDEWFVYHELKKKRYEEERKREELKAKARRGGR